MKTVICVYSRAFPGHVFKKSVQWQSALPQKGTIVALGENVTQGEVTDVTTTEECIQIKVATDASLRALQDHLVWSDGWKEVPFPK